MILELVVSLITLACIILFVVWLAMQPQKRILRIAMPVFLVSFTIIYLFYLIAKLVPDDPAFGIPAAFSAFVETFGSFTNGVAYSDIAESDRVINVFGPFWFETLFWALHMLVIITLAISGFAVFGRKLMDKIRLRLYIARRAKNIYFIFGDTEGALIFGKNVAESDPKAFLVYFSDEYNDELRERIADFGGALIETSKKTREKYERLADRVAPQNKLVFEGLEKPLVNNCSVADLLARKVIRDNAPYKVMLRDNDANNDYKSRFPETPYAALIVGFGELGRACLKQLIVSAQLTVNGTKPKFYVINRNPIAFQRFQIENPDISRCADIQFIPGDVFSFQCRDAITSAVDCKEAPLRQVYVCSAPVVVSSFRESEAALDRLRDAKNFLVDILSRQGFFKDETSFAERGAVSAETDCRIDANASTNAKRPKLVVAPSIEETDIWTPEIILNKSLDRRAIYLSGYRKLKNNQNATFNDYLKRWSNPKKKEFHRDSSRAAADFLDAYYALLGIEKRGEEGANEFISILEKDGDALEALGQIEHNRWAAFHFCNGYSPMSEEEFVERISYSLSYPDETFRPQQDFVKKTHAALIPWEKLPEIEHAYAKIDERIRNGEATLQDYNKNNVILASRFVDV